MRHTLLTPVTGEVVMRRLFACVTLASSVDPSSAVVIRRPACSTRLCQIISGLLGAQLRTLWWRVRLEDSVEMVFVRVIKNCVIEMRCTVVVVVGVGVKTVNLSDSSISSDGGPQRKGV
jgi:hypothetical protein